MIIFRNQGIIDKFYKEIWQQKKFNLFKFKLMKKINKFIIFKFK